MNVINKPKTSDITTGPLPASRKVYIEGKIHAGVRVPVPVGRLSVETFLDKLRFPHRGTYNGVRSNLIEIARVDPRVGNRLSRRGDRQFRRTTRSANDCVRALPELYRSLA